MTIESIILPNTSAMVAAIKPGDLNEVLKDSDNLISQAMRVPMDTASWNREIFAAAGDLRKMLRTRIKAAEDLRKSWTKPINDGVKLINSFFISRVEPLEKADYHIEQIMLKWSREEEARVAAEQRRLRKVAEDEALHKAQEAEAIARKAREDEAAAASVGNLLAADAAAEIAHAAEVTRDEVIDQAAAMPVADATVRRARGMYGSTSSVRKVWKARIVNLRAMPDEAIALIMESEDAKDAIRKALKPLIETHLTRLRINPSPSPIQNVNLLGIEFYEDDSIQIR